MSKQTRGTKKDDANFPHSRTASRFLTLHHLIHERSVIQVIPRMQPTSSIRCEGCHSIAWRDDSNSFKGPECWNMEVERSKASSHISLRPSTERCSKLMIDFISSAGLAKWSWSIRQFAGTYPCAWWRWYAILCTTSRKLTIKRIT